MRPSCRRANPRTRTRCRGAAGDAVTRSSDGRPPGLNIACVSLFVLREALCSFSHNHGPVARSCVLLSRGGEYILIITIIYCYYTRRHPPRESVCLRSTAHRVVLPSQPPLVARGAYRPFGTDLARTSRPHGTEARRRPYSIASLTLSLSLSVSGRERSPPGHTTPRVVRST